jgi:pilus assembly protein Flp/PilA
MITKFEKGQGLAEYALILALIAIAAVVALLFLSGVITSILSLIGHSL